MITFNHPIYLLALTAIIPLLVIHLLNKRDPKPLLFSSIQLFRHSESQKIKRFSFNEFWLFLFRSLLLIVIVLILVDPLIKKVSGDNREKWILIDPQVDEALIIADIDSLEKNGFIRHYLQSGLPTKKNEINHSPVNIWSLINEADRYASEIHIYSNSLRRNFRLKRPPINAIVFWNHVSSENPRQTYTIAENGHQFKLISSESLSYFERSSGSKTQPEKTVSIEVYFDPEFKTDLQFMEAALLSLESIGLAKIRYQVNAIKGDLKITDSDWVFWLSKQKIPENIVRKTLRFRSADYLELISGTGNSYYLNKRLIVANNEDVYSSALPGSLAKMIFTLPESEIRKNDQRIMSYQQMKVADATEDISDRQEQKSIIDYFFYLTLVLLILERLYSVKRTV